MGAVRSLGWRLQSAYTVARLAVAAVEIAGGWLYELACRREPPR